MEYEVHYLVWTDVFAVRVWIRGEYVGQVRVERPALAGLERGLRSAGWVRRG